MREPLDIYESTDVANNSFVRNAGANAATMQNVGLGHRTTVSCSWKSSSDIKITSERATPNETPQIPKEVIIEKL